MDREGIIARHKELSDSIDYYDTKIFMNPLKTLKSGNFILYERFFVKKEEVKELMSLLQEMFNL